MKLDNTLEFAQIHLAWGLAQESLEILLNRGYKIAMAESCTGGLLSYHLTAIQGASAVLEGAMITYANNIKNSWLDVSEEDLREHGAVSEPVVRSMCNGILKQSKADVALATSGVAGPGGGSIEKPVGCVYIGVQIKGEEANVVRYQFHGDRHAIQLQSCVKAFEMLVGLLQS